jgi:hypothetical protein
MRSSVEIDYCQLDDSAERKDNWVGADAVDGGIVDEICWSAESGVQSWHLSELALAQLTKGASHLLCNIGDVVESCPVLILVTGREVHIQGETYGTLALCNPPC